MGKANISLLRTGTVFTPFENMGLDSRNAVIVVGFDLRGGGDIDSLLVLWDRSGQRDPRDRKQ